MKTKLKPRIIPISDAQWKIFLANISSRIHACK